MSSALTEHQHAPDLWTPVQSPEGDWSIVCRGWPFATLYYDYRFTCNAETFSRAHLIAAAPEMLAVLNFCRIALKNRDQRPSEMALLDAIKAVIAKAEGTEHQHRGGG